jgi:hypothetical protein
MNAFAASVLLGGTMLCAHAYGEQSAAEPTVPDAHATHDKLMKECLDKERSQNSAAASGDTSNTRKLCAMRVRTQMQRLKDAGAVPPGSERQPLPVPPQ